MGWGRTLFLGDIGNRLDIADVEQEVQRLRKNMHAGEHNDTVQDNAIEQLIYENAELKLYLAALIRLLISNSTVSQEDIEKMVSELDASDGRMDGKYDGWIS